MLVSCPVSRISACGKNEEWQLAFGMARISCGVVISHYYKYSFSSCFDICGYVYLGLVGEWQWPFRGVRVGEARHPGPPHRSRTAAELAAMNTQQTSNAPATPQGIHEGPEVEILSPIENDTIEATREMMMPNMEIGGVHSDGFVDALLDRLNSFPSVSPISTYSFIPKSLTRRYAKLINQSLEWWVKEARCPVIARSLKRAEAAFLCG